MDMTIVNKGKEIVITIPANLIEMSDIQEFIDYIRYKALISKSKAKPEEVQKLVEEINQSLREKNKSMTQQ